MHNKTRTKHRPWEEHLKMNQKQRNQGTRMDSSLSHRGLNCILQVPNLHPRFCCECWFNRQSIHLTSHVMIIIKKKIKYISKFPKNITILLCVVNKYLSRGMRFPTMWYVRPATPQVSCTYAQYDQSLC